MKDCIVVGGGPAGLSAALYLARFLRSVTVFDAGEGRAGMIPKTHNLAAHPDGVSGADLLGRMRAHAARYGAVIEQAIVGVVEKRDRLFHVTTDRGVARARSVVFATGVVNHRPPLSSEEHDRGLARGLIRYCPVCDAHEVRDKRIAVLGSGAHGCAEAQFVRSYSAFVTLIPPDGAVAGPCDGVRVLRSPLADMALTNSEVVVTLAHGETERFDTLYVALGTARRTGLAEMLGVELTEDGGIRVDAKQQTSVHRAYAIGDVTDGLDQIAVAMGHGALAATAIHNDLAPRPR